MNNEQLGMTKISADTARNIKTIAEKNTFFPLALRVVLFLISITVYLFLNAILFTDTYISKRFKYEKEIIRKHF